MRNRSRTGDNMAHRKRFPHVLYLLRHAPRRDYLPCNPQSTTSFQKDHLQRLKALCMPPHHCDSVVMDEIKPFHVSCPRLHYHDPVKQQGGRWASMYFQPVPPSRRRRIGIVLDIPAIQTGRIHRCCVAAPVPRAYPLRVDALSQCSGRPESPALASSCQNARLRPRPVFESSDAPAQKQFDIHLFSRHSFGLCL